MASCGESGCSISGLVTSPQVGTVKKLTFEPIISARSGRGPKFRPSGRRLNFELSPTSGESGNGPKVQPVKYRLQVMWVQHERIA